VTIAATRAQDGSKGLFSNGESTMSWRDVPLIFRERSKHPTFNNSDLADFPLLQRAWVAQEIFLSRQFVHFCEGMIVFECMEGCCCTCGDESEYDHGELKDPIWSSLPPEVYDAEDEYYRKRRPEHFGRWISAVMFYTKLSLTFDKDRLPAISGLARRFAEKYGCTYAAGLEDLNRLLMWHHNPPANRDRESTAPTWSWASSKDEKVVFYGIGPTQTPAQSISGNIIAISYCNTQYNQYNIESIH
jgi:hypothetical protein